MEHQIPMNLNETDKEIANTMMKDCVNIIEAIEFFEDDNGEYQSAQIDQLYNLPSIMSSKANVSHLVSNDLRNLSPDQIYDVGFVAKTNQLYIISEQIYAAVNSNLSRYLRSNNLFSAIQCIDYRLRLWIDEDKINDTRDLSFQSVKKIIMGIMFDRMNRSTISTFKDNEEGFKNSFSCINICTEQLVAYISAVISFKYNTIIDTDCEDIDTLDRIHEYIKNTDEYKTMSSMYTVFDAKEASKMIYKQLVARYMFIWFNEVLRGIILNIMNGFGLTNYYMIDDMGRFKCEDCKKNQK